MKRTGERNFYIQSSNTHLVNILEDNYYMELGVVSLKTINKLLARQVIDLAQLIYFEILNSGVGAITNDFVSDVNFQLNYLLSLRQKSSSNKFFLTCGMMRYIDELGCERYAPIVLIPIEIDYQNARIVCSSSPLPNRLLLKKISTLIKETPEDQNRFVDTNMANTFTTIGQIDKYCEELAKEANLKFSPSNFLTVCKVEYYDFAISSSFFTPERSVYETTSQEIIHNYFRDIKAILPTNIDQKHVILKVDHGDNFAVDGRLGSGKTYTILNIIADQILKGKKILYVNQDLDNIWDLEKNLRFLKIDHYAYNLTKNLRNITVPEAELPVFLDKTWTDENMETIKQFEHGLSIKTNGFTHQYIMENLAVIKNSRLDLIPMEIEISLEKYEVNDIYQSLKKVEECLLKIDRYDTNIWKKLHTSHNNITLDEIKERTNRLYDLQITLKEEVEKYCKKYQLQIPKHIHDLNKLIEHIVSFSAVTPLPVWQVEEVRKQAITALREIQTLSDTHFNLTKYYTSNINSEYTPGRAKQILKELCSDFIKIKNTDNYDDTIFVDRLLASNNRIHVLIDGINTNLDKLESLSKQIFNIFAIKKFERYMYGFFEKVEAYLDDHMIETAWVTTYLTDPKKFKSIGEIFKVKHEELQKCRKSFEGYLLHDNGLFNDEIRGLIEGKQFDRLVQKYFDKKTLKNEHLNIQNKIDEVKEYHQIGKLLNIYVKNNSYRGNTSDEFQWTSFAKFCEFTNALDSKEEELFGQLLKLNKNKSIIDLSEYTKILKNFKAECYQSDSLATQLENYNIIISDEYSFEKRDGLRKSETYLRKSVTLKEELNNIFNSNTRITYNQVAELIEADKQYLEMSKTIDAKEKTYISLLGSNYQKFDTVISNTGQTIEHFAEFSIRIQKGADIDKLLKTENLNGLIKGAVDLRSLCSDWITALRQFSLCFKGGKSNLQEEGFANCLNIMKNFVLSINQIEPILYINHVRNKVRDHHLLCLDGIIEKAVENDKLADSYLYESLTRLHNSIIIKRPYMLDFANYENSFSQYETYEIDYCTKNIQELQRMEEKRPKGRLGNIKFNDYDRIITSMGRNISLFMADLDIFNGKIDLEPFDLVIIDDGHLSSSNKYNRIVECRQVVVFGDKSFQSSIANTLMQRIAESCIVPYHNRYVRMSPRFNNLWTAHNRYVYSFDTQVTKQKINSLAHLAQIVVEFFNKNTRHIINVVVGNENTRRDIYAKIILMLQRYYSTSEIIEILCYNIRIINAQNEGSRYVNDAIIYYNDFLDYEDNQKELIFKNFVVISNGIYIYYVGHKREQVNQEILKDINRTIGKNIHHLVHPTGIAKLLYDRLKTRNINVSDGFGAFDFIIKEANTVAIMIIGKADDESYSLLDEYGYYYREYQRNGWIVEILYSGELINNFDQTIEEVIKLAKGDENDKK